MSGERQGWKNWDDYKKAGIVDEHVNFTDNDVVTDHALGKTKDTVGMCYPIDAAVAYTLAAAGPDANLSSADMVNQYTRMATVMMSQRVGYGDVPDPKVPSCGHDMVDTTFWHFLVPTVHKVKEQGANPLTGEEAKESLYITWTSRTGYGSRGCYNLGQWLQSYEGEQGTEKTVEMLELSKIRADSLTDDGSMPTAMTAFQIMMKPEYKELREFIETQLGTTKWLLEDYSSGTPIQAFTGEHTSGVCGWADDDTKTCGHHDKPTMTDWVLIKKKDGNGYEELWSRAKGEASVHKGWNSDQVRSTLGYSTVTKMSPSRVVLWENVSRSLAQTIDDKKVIKSINEALRRMTARNRNVVTKEGLRSDATYNWKEWGWLTEMQAWVAQTSKKNRKEGDIVNGWVYTKYGARKSYGHEIAHFKWKPEERHCTYTIKLTGGYSYYNAEMPFRFKDKPSAMQYKQFLTMMAGKVHATNKDGRIWDGESGMEKVVAGGAFKIVTNQHEMSMPMNSDPEYLPNPTTILNALMFGTPQEFDEHIKHLTEETQKYFHKPTVEMKKEGVE